MHARALTAAALALALGSPIPGGSALAEESAWRVVSDRSTITFDYVLNGTERKGVFERVEGEGTTSDGDPGTARFELRIESASIELGQALVTAYASSAEWFDARNHPFVTYRMARLTPAAEGEAAFTALGDVTIKGTTQVLEVPVDLSIADDEVTARGEITVNRREFGLGTGPTELAVTLAPEVRVRFDILAERAR